MESKVQSLYLQTQVNTATPQELTHMLYNGCIKFMKQAQQEIEQQDMTMKNYYIQRAQDIINEFIITLNMQYPIALEFKNHYDFVNLKLIEANVKADTEILKFCIEHMTEFRNTWVQVIKLAKTDNKVSI